jgi:hypothetical protein
MIMSGFLSANSQFKTLEWSVLERSDVVTVFGRGVKGRPSAREIKAITVVPQSPESLLALMLDYPNATTWRQSVKRITKERSLDDDNWFIHYVTDLPWPLDDRVAYLRCQVIRDKKTGAITYAFDSAPTDDGLTEEETLSGSYKFEPQGNGKTKVTYQVILDSPVKVPDWLMNALIGGSFLNQMEMLKDAVAHPRYIAAD